MSKPAIISEHKNRAYLLEHRSYESTYARLKDILSEDELSCFADVLSRDSIRERHWFVKESNFVSIAKCTEEEKMEAAIYISKYKQLIQPKLATDPELGIYAEELFTIPSESSIFLVRKDGRIRAVLAEWACLKSSDAPGSNPLSKFLDLPRKEYSQVTAVIRYSDGNPYGEQAITVQYMKKNLQKFHTDGNGYVIFGMMKHGETFTIGDAVGEKKSPSFFISPETTHFEAVFPYYASADISVIDQKEEPLPGYSLQLKYGDELQSLVTNEEGKVGVEKILLTDGQISLEGIQTKDTKQVYGIGRADNHLVYRAQRQLMAPLTILVKDADGEPESNHRVEITYGEQQRVLATDDSGQIIFESLPVGTEVTSVSLQDKSVTGNLTIKEGQNECLLTLSRVIQPVAPIIETVRIKLVDSKDKAIPDTKMILNAPSGPIERVTNQDGVVEISQDLMPSEESKVSVRVHKKGFLSKTIGKKLLYKPEDLNYVLKLRNYRWLLWLLLLILPLLLLIPYEKDITVQALDKTSGNTVAGTEVQFRYIKHALYDSDGFLSSVPKSYSDTTDAEGLVRFSNLRTTLFSLIFKMNTKAVISAVTPCFAVDNLESKFHFIGSSPIMLNMEPVMIPLDFLVIDHEDNEPLPDASLIAVTELKSMTWEDSTRTGADGKGILSKNPKCGKFVRITASLPGYFPDSISMTLVELLAGGGDTLAKRTLRLKPIKKNIKFSVINCKTKEPIAGAKATIILIGMDPAKRKEYFTNINGVGKGGYDSLHITKRIKIEVERVYFKSGIWDKDKTVEEFRDLPDAERVICLEPEDKALEFTDIDSLTRSPLAGVKNVVTVASGKSVKKDTIVSNKNGKFTVVVNVGDKVSIYGMHEPNYEPNGHTINDRDAEPLITGGDKNRRIPLKPKEFVVKFRTIDIANQNAILDNVILEVLLDGKATMPNNSGSGEFEVRGYFNSNLSIIAKKEGYITNDTKVYNKPFSFLTTAPQSDRDIPLGIKPCGVSTNGNKSGQSYYIDQFDLGAKSGTIVFSYYTDTHPDTISVYCGPKDQIGPHNRLFYYSEATGENNKLTTNISFTCSTLTVEVRGGSKWSYTVNCP